MSYRGAAAQNRRRKRGTRSVPFGHCSNHAFQRRGYFRVPCALLLITVFGRTIPAPHLDTRSPPAPRPRKINLRLHILQTMDLQNESAMDRSFCAPGSSRIGFEAIRCMDHRLSHQYLIFQAPQGRGPREGNLFCPKAVRCRFRYLEKPLGWGSYALLSVWSLPKPCF